MKGLILAGGFATRLRPLSCSKPKLLFPVVGVPLVDIMIRWLKDGGVKEVILAVNHLSDRLRIEIGERRLGSKVVLSVERDPLGTAGPIRLARDFLLGDEPFIVVNGDIVSDIKLKDLLRTHDEHSAVATIALVKVRDMKPYGSVALDAKSRITRFEEKSQRESESKLINGGAYVLDPKVIDLIPGKGPVSLERSIFPKLAAGGGLWGWKHHSYWYDIGRIADYRRANMELLKRWRNSEKIEPMSGVVVTSPSYIGQNPKLSNGVRVGPHTILSRNVALREHTIVKRSIVFEDTIIGKECIVDGALIGEKVVVGDRVRIESGTIVAGEISVPDDSVIRQNSVILT